MEQGAPGRPDLLDGRDVRRHAHGGHFHEERRRCHAGHLRPADDGQAARDVPFHRLAGLVPADAFARRQLAAGHRRRRRDRFLLVQLPDHPGGPQHEDAGDRLLPVGAGRARLYLPEHRIQAPLARESHHRRRPVRPRAEHAGQGQPPADHLLPGDPGDAVCPGLLHRHPGPQGKGLPGGENGTEDAYLALFHRVGPAAGRGPRGHRHEREQAASGRKVHAEHDARGLGTDAGRGDQGQWQEPQRPGPGICHGVVLRLE